MITTYMNYIANQYDTKKWFINNDKADAIVSILKNKLPNELIQLIIDSCYEEIIIPYSYDWTDNLDVYSKKCEAYILTCDTHDMKNLKIIFDKNWFKLFIKKYIRCNIIDSNNDHFRQNTIKLLHDHILCSGINRGRNNCKHILKDGTANITLMYQKFSYSV